jgi:hypothetical protein
MALPPKQRAGRLVVAGQRNPAGSSPGRGRWLATIAETSEGALRAWLPDSATTITGADCKAPPAGMATAWRKLLLAPPHWGSWVRAPVGRVWRCAFPGKPAVRTRPGPRRAAQTGKGWAHAGTGTILVKHWNGTTRTGSAVAN